MLSSSGIQVAEFGVIGALPEDRSFHLRCLTKPKGEMKMSTQQASSIRANKKKLFTAYCTALFMKSKNKMQDEK